MTNCTVLWNMLALSKQQEINEEMFSHIWRYADQETPFCHWWQVITHSLVINESTHIHVHNQPSTIYSRPGCFCHSKLKATFSISFTARKWIASPEILISVYSKLPKSGPNSYKLSWSSGPLDTSNIWTNLRMVRRHYCELYNNTTQSKGLGGGGGDLLMDVR